MAAFVRWYLEKLKTRPLLANACTGSTLNGVGDIIAQRTQYMMTHQDAKDTGVIVEGSIMHVDGEPWHRVCHVDLRRTLLMMSFSCFVGTPMALQIYKVGDYFFKTKSIVNAIKQGFFTTMTFGLTTPVFFAYCTVAGNLVLRRHETSSFTAYDHLRSAVTKVERDFLSTLRYMLAFWSVHWIPLFYLLPKHVRLLYSSCVTIGWSSIMSWIQHRKVVEEIIEIPETVSAI